MSIDRYKKKIELAEIEVTLRGGSTLSDEQREILIKVLVDLHNDKDPLPPKGRGGQRNYEQELEIKHHVDCLKEYYQTSPNATRPSVFEEAARYFSLSPDAIKAIYYRADYPDMPPGLEFFFIEESEDLEEQIDALLASPSRDPESEN